MKNSTIIALDVGSVFVGVAIARAGSSVALPIGSFERKAGKAERDILNLVSDEKPDMLIAGLPLNEEGVETPECEKIRTFCRRIERRSGTTVLFVDEYGSTLEARQRLEYLKRKEAKEKGALDSVSASIILQRFLDEVGERRD